VLCETVGDPNLISKSGRGCKRLRLFTPFVFYKRRLSTVSSDSEQITGQFVSAKHTDRSLLGDKIALLCSLHSCLVLLHFILVLLFAFVCYQHLCLMTPKFYSFIKTINYIPPRLLFWNWKTVYTTQVISWLHSYVARTLNVVKIAQKKRTAARSCNASGHDTLNYDIDNIAPKIKLHRLSVDLV